MSLAPFFFIVSLEIKKKSDVAHIESFFSIRKENGCVFEKSFQFGVHFLVISRFVLNVFFVILIKINGIKRIENA